MVNVSSRRGVRCRPLPRDCIASGAPALCFAEQPLLLSLHFAHHDGRFRPFYLANSEEKRFFGP